MTLRMAYMHSPHLGRSGLQEMCRLGDSRPRKVRERLIRKGRLGEGLAEEVIAGPTTPGEMLQFHTQIYIDVLARASKGDHDYAALARGLGTPDCPIFRGMFEHIAAACGGTTHGASLILDGKYDVVFNLAGGFHNALPGYASGFCYVNDVVLAATTLAEAGKRVFVLDLDAHHGNGVQQAFYPSNRVSVCSLHESGETLFPGTGVEGELGVGDGLGHNLNIPLPVGTHDAAYTRAIDALVLPMIERVSPDVFVVVLGMDALARDTWAHLNLTDECLSQILVRLARTGKPMLVTGGGGYNVDATVDGWVASFETLCHLDDPQNREEPAPRIERSAWFADDNARPLLSHAGYRHKVDRAVDDTIARISNHLGAISSGQLL